MKDWDKFVGDDGDWIIVSIQEIFEGDNEVFIVKSQEDLKDLDEKWLNVLFLKSYPHLCVGLHFNSTCELPDERNDVFPDNGHLLDLVVFDEEVASEEQYHAEEALIDFLLRPDDRRRNEDDD